MIGSASSEEHLVNRNEMSLARQRNLASLSARKRAILNARRMDLKESSSTEACHLRGELPGDWRFVKPDPTARGRAPR